MLWGPSGLGKMTVCRSRLLWAEHGGFVCQHANTKEYQRNMLRGKRNRRSVRFRPINVAVDTKRANCELTKQSISCLVIEFCQLGSKAAWRTIKLNGGTYWGYGQNLRWACWSNKWINNWQTKVPICQICQSLCSTYFQKQLKQTSVLDKATSGNSSRDD